MISKETTLTAAYCVWQKTQLIHIHLLLSPHSDEDDDEENDAKDFIAKDEDAR